MSLRIAHGSVVPAGVGIAAIILSLLVSIHAGCSRTEDEPDKRPTPDGAAAAPTESEPAERRAEAAGKAEEKLRELGYLNPDPSISSPEVHLNLATLHMQKGHLTKALQEFERAMRLAPENPNVHAGLASCLAQQGRLQEARKELQVALGLDADNPMTRTSLGYVRMEMGRLDEAREALEEVLDQDPTFVPAILAMGICQGKQGNWIVARAHFEEATRVAPKNPYAVYNLGLSLERVGETEKAVETYRKVLEMEPANRLAAVNLGRIYQEKGELDKAIAQFESVVAAHEGDRAAFYNLGTAQMLAGEKIGRELVEVRAGLVEKRRALEAEETKDASSEAKAESLRNEISEIEASIEAMHKEPMEQFEKAVKMLKEAIVLDAGFEYAHNNLARTYTLMGDARNAYMSYDRMTQLFPETPDPWLQTALAIARGGNDDEQRTEEARRRLKRALETGGERILQSARARPALRKLEIDELWKEVRD